MVPPKKTKQVQVNTGADATKLRPDHSATLSSHEAAVLRFLHMGYVGLIMSDKDALSGLEAKGLAQHIMGGWLLTSLGKSFAQHLEPGSKMAPEIVDEPD